MTIADEQAQVAARAAAFAAWEVEVLSAIFGAAFDRRGLDDEQRHAVLEHLQRLAECHRRSVN